MEHLAQSHISGHGRHTFVVQSRVYVAARSTVAFCSVSRTAERPGKKNTTNTATPNDPKARDEGPRLLPLEEEQRTESRLDHYIKLANVALGLWRTSKGEKLPPTEGDG
jgi:hypothetical protein